MYIKTRVHMPFNDRLIVILLKVCPLPQHSVLTGAQTRMEKEYSNFSITIPEAK